MSTPLLSSQHFAAACDSLVHYATEGRNERSCAMIASQLCRSLGVTPFGNDSSDVRLSVESLIFDLQRINAAAYARRYEKKVPKIKLSKRGQLLSIPALLKALSCIRYNCDGGECLGALEKLDAVIDAVKFAVIESIPEYQKAEWFL